MGSLMKMFKTSKKSCNKENQPTVSFDTNSLKKTNFVYTGEAKIDNRLKSPYAVITEPKKTKGPRSCPGGPIDDNEMNWLKEKNTIRKNCRSRDDSELSRLNQFDAYRHMLAKTQYDNMTTYESDDDELYEARIRAIQSRNAHLEAKVQRMHRRLVEERSTMSQQIEMLQDENYRLKKLNDRIHRQYLNAKSQLDVERKQKSDLLKMLHDANKKIELLETNCDENINDESINTSSLLCPFGTRQEMLSEGAGEALCFPEIESNNAVIINKTPNSLKDDVDNQDEVRIFRNLDEVKKKSNNEEEEEELIENNEKRGNSSGSEEERLSLIERQLRKKGEVVKFNPPRQTVQSKHFKRFGKWERSALAEFEYLQDMSTDVSGMMSSPDHNN